jgi:TetR/AcrR family transcriptional regulator
MHSQFFIIESAAAVAMPPCCLDDSAGRGAAVKMPAGMGDRRLGQLARHPCVVDPESAKTPEAWDGEAHPKKTMKMTISNRRMGAASSETRAQLIEAAAEIVRNDGCGAVTARRLAEKVGLKRQIVHYYFRTIEDLLIAVIRRDGENFRARVMQSMESDQPLRAIWEASRRASKTTILEFTSLATHRKAVQVEVKRYMEEIRRFQTQALVRHFELRGIKPPLPPAVMLIGILGVSQVLAVEALLDVSEGHSEMVAFVEDRLGALAREGKALVRRPAPERMRSKTR